MRIFSFISLLSINTIIIVSSISVMSKKLLTKVFNSSPQNIFSLQVTGGGIDSLRRVFTTPGASNSVLNAGVPYCRSIQLDLLDIDTVIS